MSKIKTGIENIKEPGEDWSGKPDISNPSVGNGIDIFVKNNLNENFNYSLPSKRAKLGSADSGLVRHRGLYQSSFGGYKD